MSRPDYYSETIGCVVSEEEARLEAEDAMRYANDSREWPHHREYARKRAAAIMEELRSVRA